MRNTKIVSIDDGRDKGKSFLLTEMSAFRAEKWAARVLCAVVNSGMPMPDEMVGSGMAGIAAIGIPQVLNFRFGEFEPLMDEMLTCIQTMPDRHDPAHVLPLDERDIDDLTTILKLRKEVLILHLGFLPPEVRSKLTSVIQQMGSRSAPTSPDQSIPSSQTS